MRILMAATCVSVHMALPGMALPVKVHVVFSYGIHESFNTQHCILHHQICATDWYHTRSSCQSIKYRLHQHFRDSGNYINDHSQDLVFSCGA